MYLHVETTNGAYANHFDQRVFNAGTFLRNIQITYTHAQLKGGNKEPYRIGLKLSNGVGFMLPGLTHFEVNEHDEFLIAGFNFKVNSLQHFKLVSDHLIYEEAST